MGTLASVIVITYRNYLQIEQTLASVLCQDYSKIELLVQDDGSEGFAEQAERIHAWIRKNSTPNLVRFEVKGLPQNVGTVENLNRALDWVSGEYVKIISPGDGFAGETSLSNYVRQLEKDNAQMVISPVVCIRGDERFLYPSSARCMFLQGLNREQTLQLLYSGNPFNIVGTVYRTALLREMGGYDARYRLLEDYPFLLRFFKEGHQIAWLKTPECYYNEGAGISKPVRNMNETYLQDIALLEADLSEWDYRYGALQPFYNKLRYACRCGDLVKYNNSMEKSKIYRECLWLAHRARQVVRRVFFNPVPKSRRMPK